MSTALYVRIESHRHRHQIKRHLGEKNMGPYCYSFKRWGNWVMLDPERVASLRNAGIRARVSRDTSDLRECLNWA